MTDGLQPSLRYSEILGRNIDPHRTMRVGALLVAVGMSGALASVEAGTVPGFFAATVVAGFGFGGGFQGGIRTVMPLAHPHERAGVLSALYVVCYVAFGLPAIVAGALVEHVGVLSTARSYAAVVVVLSLIAVAGSVITSRRNARQAELIAAAYPVGSSGSGYTNMPSALVNS